MSKGINLFERFCFGKRASGCPTCTGTPKKVFLHIQESRHLEARADMVGPATARAGGRHWHCSCDVGFAGIQNARVVGLQRFHPDFRGRLGGQSVCGRVGMPGGSP